MKKRGLDCGRLSFFEAVQSARSLDDILVAVGYLISSNERCQIKESLLIRSIRAEETEAAVITEGNSCSELNQGKNGENRLRDDQGCANLLSCEAFSSTNKRKRIEY
jgi:hypothetical protein